MTLDLGCLDAPPETNNGAPLMVSIDAVMEDPHNPRPEFSGLVILDADIQAHGILQPIVVHPPLEGRCMIRFGARHSRFHGAIARSLGCPFSTPRNHFFLSERGDLMARIPG